jgi:hypothetical protein
MTRKPMNVPIWLTRSMGLRPTESEMRPRSGPEMSWQTAYDETRSVASKGVAWKRSA